jgi:hypothetical protein
MDKKLDLEILQLQGARFVRIPRGLKGPQSSDWHKYPLTVDQIDIGKDNLGIILNSSSNGIVAIDFDGFSSIDYFYKLFPNTNIDTTVSFTSTRPGRHQRLYRISREYFDYLSLKQLKTGTIDSDGKHEQLELRFQKDKSAQSVLPPSFVSDDKGERTYQWLEGCSPQETDIIDLPDEVLAYWLTICNEVYEPKESVILPHTDDMVAHLAETLQKYYPVLSYDEWIRVAWGFKHSVGDSIALDIMRYYWPERQQGEYKKLMRSQSNGKRCSLGTIRYMIKQRGGNCAVNPEEIHLCNLLNSKKKR